MQLCPSYFGDFDPSEKVTKVCNTDGQWFRHPDSDRTWSNYTLCTAYTQNKLKLALSLYYMAIVGHTLSVIGCKVLATLMIYILASIYFWMLCEGIYLHTLIIVAVFVGEQHLGWYYLLGWGFPLVPTVTYAIARSLYFDDK
ncbi:hypothetical protein JZ751_007350 [Albula glossodonta]|uniref:Uncharacterized protein n=1 Tax=Albula glossodonta TaxID=121402 RepID=A0A8T2MXR1_9TELE|nr:hypothetical protein JZ751_007350 [Albula glossodonta]